jgi:hypothetical protein
LIATSNAMFVCPQCANTTLSIHRKTYERSVIAFCTNCHLNSAFSPSKEAFFDTQLTYKEFIAQYNQKKTQEKTASI